MINLKESEGKDGKWYRYWSDKAKDSMEAHVARLMEAYGDNYVTVLCEGRERKPICSMWDPIVAPSFDEEGKSRYLRWLSDEYQGDIRLFNQAYGVEKESFASLEKEDYWFECRYEKDVLTDETDRSRLTFSEEDVKNQTPRARMLMDNRKWQCKELCLYFEDICITSLSRANEWAKLVIPELGKKKQTDIAILFPSAMAAYETMHTEGNKERRMDLLGWYQACRDLGLEADVTDSISLCGDISSGMPQNTVDTGECLLDCYKILIIPDNDCYGMNPDSMFEAVLRSWCERGGTVLYGPNCTLAGNCFGTEAVAHEADAIYYHEAGMVKSREFCSYPCNSDEIVASYLSDGAPCVTRYQTQKGCQYGFGFSYGAAYNTKFVPHVPIEQKNHELYPLEMMKENILADILKDSAGISTNLCRRIERACFENGLHLEKSC